MNNNVIKKQFDSIGSNFDIVPQYNVFKQKYSSEEKLLLSELRENLVDLAISSDESLQVNEDKLLNDIKNFLFAKLANNSQNNAISNEYLDNLARKLFQDLVGYGEIDPLIRDDNLEEIMVIGIDKPVFVYHREYGMMKTNILFKDAGEVMNLIDSIARQINRRIDQESPILDGRLPDGSRVNATIPPISADGPSMTIRKFKRDPLTIIDLINSKTISVELAAFFWLCFDGLGVKSANAIISGGTSSGKTTTLNALINEINEKENKKILTLEKPVEFKHQCKKSVIVQKEVGRGGDVPNFRDGVKNALREDCDILVIGEIRDRETMEAAIDMAESGHLVIGTLHTKSCAETIDRMINFYEVRDQASIKYLMSALLKLVVSQRLLKGTDGKLVLLPEVMVVDNIVAGCIRKEKFSVSELEDAIQSNIDKGSISLINSIAQLFVEDKITLQQAKAQIEEKNIEILNRTIMQMKIKRGQIQN